MPASARTRRLHWAAPLVVAAVIALIALIPQFAAGADTPTLDALTPQQLLVKVQQANVQALSGTINLTTNLGIPNLSALGDIAGRGSVVNPVDFLSGSHQASIWVDGPDRQRIALPSSLAETDVIHNGPDVWTWQSSGSKVQHITGVPSHGTSTGAPTTETPAVETPAQLADKVLAQVNPSTAVTVGTPLYVAGQSAYELDIAPRSADSTVDHIAIAVDSATGLPLKVSIYAKTQPTAAALELGFSQITYGRPAASNFTFTPPPGATVTTKTVGSGTGAKAETTPGTETQPAATPAPSGTKVVGSDWTQVVIASLPNGLPREASIVLKNVPTVTGAFGSGQLLETPLVNVLVLSDGRVAAGAVTVAALESAVASAH